MLKIGKWMILAMGFVWIAGCGTGEGLLLGAMTKHSLPKLKKEAEREKAVFVTGQACLHKADTVEEANACNQKMMAMDPDLEIGDFKKWDEAERRNVDRMANDHIRFYDCILNAQTISEATECKEPESL
jgi:hypothetical protein